MFRDYVKPLVIFLITVTLTFFICFTINMSSSTLQNGQALPTSGKYTVHNVSSYKYDTRNGRYYFDIVNQEKQPSLAIVYGIVESDIYINDAAVAPAVNFSKFSSLTLDNASFDQSNVTSLSLYSNRNPNNLPIYITTKDGAARAVFMYHMVFAFCLGVTALMSVYGINLYINKKSEKYLVWFSVYTGALTLWSLTSIFSEFNMDFLQPLFSHAYGWCALLDIVICFKMFDIKLPGRFNALIGAKGVAATLAIWAIIESMYDKIIRDYYYIFFISIIVLIYASAKGKKGALTLLAGHTISFGMRLVIAFSLYNLLPVSYALMVMRYSKLFNIPFAICCMFLINKLFSEKFIEAEMLADKLESANKILEFKVEERTKELQEKQRQRNAFMVNIFHDLRTPVFILDGCVQKIKKHPQIASQEIPIIDDRLDFVKHLVDDLFLMAKFEDNQVIMETERVSLNHVLNRVVSSSLMLAGKKNITFSSKIDCICITWGDEYRLEQAFQNITINAIYYTKPWGQVSIQLDKEDKMAFVTIKDTGDGIKEEDIDKIFNRYYKISGMKKHGSTGLGLSIANEIINNHRGSINVKSKLGIGSEFIITLPLISE